MLGTHTHSFTYVINIKRRKSFINRMYEQLLVLNRVLICSHMDGPRDDHIKWSKSEKDKYHIISRIFWIYKKWYKWSYLQSRNRLTDIENKLMVPKEGGRR